MNLSHELELVTRDQVEKAGPMTPRISFEFFPTKTVEAGFRLSNTLQDLAAFDPDFVSVTYGAGGSSRDATSQVASAINSHFGLRTAAHLTCVGLSKSEVLDYADGLSTAGISEIVALRGDVPEGGGRFTPTNNGFASACDLIEALAKTGKFQIRVAAYPERHPESASTDADIDWLKRKIDSGASSAITQFFFEAETFLRFRDQCAAKGITAPIIPGILPVNDWNATKRVAKKCATNIPDWLNASFETALRDNREDLLSISVATELCSELLENGVEDLHFYTMNRSKLTKGILTALGLPQKQALRRVA